MCSRYYGRRLTTLVLACLALLFASPQRSPANDAIEVVLPPVTAWCKAEIVSSEELSNPELANARMDSVIQSLGKILADLKIYNVGRPYLEEFSIQGKDAVRAVFCAIASNATPPPAASAIEVRRRHAIKVLATSCAADDSDMCLEKLFGILQKPPYNVPLDKLDDLRVLSDRGLMLSDYAATIIAVLNNASAMIYDQETKTVVTAPVPNNAVSIVAVAVPIP